MVLHNCEEVINFMVNSYSDAYVGYAEFQGDTVGFCGAPLQANMLIMSPDNPCIAFLVSFPKDDVFYLQIVKECATLDELLTAILPAHVFDEMVSTLKGRTHSEHIIRKLMSIMHYSIQEAIAYLEANDDMEQLPF